MIVKIVAALLCAAVVGGVSVAALKMRDFKARQLQPVQQARVRRPARARKVAARLPQETRLYAQVVETIPPEELADLLGVAAEGRSPFQVALEVRARLSSLLRELYTIYQNRLYVYLDPRMDGVYKQLEAQLGRELRYDEAADEFAGAASADTLRNALKTMHAYKPPAKDA